MATKKGTTPGINPNSVNADGTPGPVVSGELIESAWGNAVSSEFQLRGVVPGGLKRLSVGQGSITTIVDITGLTVTFTAKGNRYYRCTFECQAVNQNASMNTFYITNGTNVVLAERSWFLASAGQSSQFVSVSAVFAPAAGAQTVKVRASSAPGSLGALQISPLLPGAEFTVEDIGPVRP